MSPDSKGVRRTLLRWVVSALVAASLAITAAQQLASDGPWWLELSRYLPFPLTLAPAVLALLLSFWLGRRWLVISATARILGLSILKDSGTPQAQRRRIRYTPV